jgi:ADP-ribose pyrophosphatase YjhB (NUDIX family)
VGGFVVNERGELLVVQELSGPAAKSLWKLPGLFRPSCSPSSGGAVDSGEYIHEAAVREVFEETGVKTTFVSLVAMRQMTQARHGRTDLYFVCLLKPLSNDIKIQEDEIAAAKWIDVHPHFPFSLLLIARPLPKDDNVFRSLSRND